MMIRLVKNVPEYHEEFTAVRSVDIQLHDEASLDDMLQAYEQFLKAIGYHWDENYILQFVENEV